MQENSRLEAGHVKGCNIKDFLRINVNVLEALPQ
jgi:hypothetical protein